MALTLNRMQRAVPLWTRFATGGPRPTQERRERLSWQEICADFEGRWVALSECCYDQSGKAVVEAVLVDTDDVLSDLCERVQDCDIVFCG